MKKTIINLSTFVAILFSVIYLSSCGSSEEHDHDEHEVHADDHDHSDHEHILAYQCPMQCEGDKTYAEAGSCPECGMDLEEIELHEDEVENHEHDESEHENEEEGSEHDHDDHEGHEH